jgi:hypothetical protein
MYLADMDEFDGFIRYTANLTGRTQREILEMGEAEQIQLIKTCNLTHTLTEFNVII